jgi:hypothetical protein
MAEFCCAVFSSFHNIPDLMTIAILFMYECTKFILIQAVVMSGKSCNYFV